MKKKYKAGADDWREIAMKLLVDLAETQRRVRVAREALDRISRVTILRAIHEIAEETYIKTFD